MRKKVAESYRSNLNQPSSQLSIRQSEQLFNYVPGCAGALIPSNEIR